MTWVDWLIIAAIVILNCFWTAGCAALVRRDVNSPMVISPDLDSLASTMAPMDPKTLSALADRVYAIRVEKGIEVNNGAST